MPLSQMPSNSIRLQIELGLRNLWYDLCPFRLLGKGLLPPPFWRHRCMLRMDFHSLDTKVLEPMSASLSVLRTQPRCLQTKWIRPYPTFACLATWLYLRVLVCNGDNKRQVSGTIEFPFRVVGGIASLTFYTFCSSIWTPFLSMICPKSSTRGFMKEYFLIISLNLLFFKILNTFAKWIACFSLFFENITTSST